VVYRAVTYWYYYLLFLHLALYLHSLFEQTFLVGSFFWIVYGYDNLVRPLRLLAASAPLLLPSVGRIATRRKVDTV
jgi:hypothetical protein